MRRTAPPAGSLWYSPDDDNPSITERFQVFHAANPRVYDLFKRFAMELLRAGHPRGSADMICHRIRWEVAINVQEGGYKINDHFTSRYARMLAAEDARFLDWFCFRQLKEAP